MLAGGALLMLAGSVTGEWARLTPAHVSAHSWIAWCYLVTFGSLIGFTAYVWLLQVASPAHVSTYAYVNPIVAVLLGWELAGEQITIADPARCRRHHPRRGNHCDVFGRSATEV